MTSDYGLRATCVASLFCRIGGAPSLLAVMSGVQGDAMKPGGSHLTPFCPLPVQTIGVGHDGRIAGAISMTRRYLKLLLQHPETFKMTESPA